MPGLGANTAAAARHRAVGDEEASGRPGAWGATRHALLEATKTMLASVPAPVAALTLGRGDDALRGHPPIREGADYYVV